jgi:transposase
MSNHPIVGDGPFTVGELLADAERTARRLLGRPITADGTSLLAGWDVVLAAASEVLAAQTTASQCAQQVRSAHHQPTHAAGRQVAEKVLSSFTSCPIPEIARLGHTLKQWSREFLGYFDTDGARNGGTEAINGLIELHRRIARGFRNRENYRLRILLIGGGLLLCTATIVFLDRIGIAESCP